ncbi:MAG: hypothetical protein ACLSGN_04070 [Oscillospiraceae bacterium]|jgi:cell division protein FtsL
MFSLLSKLIIIAVIIGCIVSIIVTQADISQMQKKLDSIVSRTEEVEADNAELQRTLDEDDINAYMEKLAIEKMNYAYPNERRYYDTSRN